MKIVKIIICVLFGLMMINSGLNKFFNYMPMPPMPADMMKVFEAFMTIKWLMPLIALTEIVGGLLFMIPKTRALGAIVILPITVGIVLHNIAFMPSGLIIGGILLLIDLWMIADNWRKYQPMIASK
jgi:putative oxidoreductase